MKQSTLHVAVIMDGNGRWANRIGLPRLAGHRAGAEALRGIVEAAPACGVGTLTAYAFSSDNWKRPQEEVDGLMTLLAWYLDGEAERLAESGVRLSVIGRRDRLPEVLLNSIARAERTTRAGTRMHLRLAIDYSAREAILRATQLIRGGSLTAEQFEEALGQSSSCSTQPVDLLIRTGGEQRLSDFLLWECAYAELIFTRRMWPEFRPADLRQAIQEFCRRERRFGAVPAVAPETLPQHVAHERWLR